MAMRRALTWFESRVLPRGWPDLLRQILILVGFYVLYGMVRLAVNGGAYDPGYQPFGDATRIINLERALHVFVEPAIQNWALPQQWLMEAASFIYLNAHLVVTGGVVLYIYLRHNRSFYLLRNAFMIAMVIALIGYALYPTAPPRLMPEWGLTDAVKQMTGITAEQGISSATLNLYAAVPSVHVCFAVLAGWSMASVSPRRWVKALSALYPVLITFVVIVTGNHYLTDVLLGAMTAGVSVVLARRVLPRVGVTKWALDEATA